MRLRHELILVRKYMRPEKIRGIIVPDNFREDHSRALWEVIDSSPEANAMLQTDLEPGWILVTPPRFGVYVDTVTGIRDDGRPENVDRFLIHAGGVSRVVPWTLGGEMPKTLGKRLLVEPDDPNTRKPETSEPLIHVVNLIEKRPVTGVIRGVGDGVEDPDLVEGVRVLYSIFAGTDLEVNGEKRVLIEADQAMLIVNEGESVEMRR